MKVHGLILFGMICLGAVGPARAADGFALPGLGQFGGGPGASSLVADQTRSLNQPQPLEKVLRTIDQAMPGRALGAKLVDRRGRQTYEIRWMGENGKVSEITADALSGKIVDRR